MRSVADDLSEEQLLAFQQLTPSERVEMACRLSEEGIAIYIEVNGVDREEAIRRMRRSRSAGRRTSRCMEQE